MLANYIMIDSEMLKNLDRYIIEWSRGFVFPLESCEFIQKAQEYLCDLLIRRNWYANIKIEKYAGRKFGIYECPDGFFINKKSFDDETKTITLSSAIKTLNRRMGSIEKRANEKITRAAERIKAADEPFTLVEQKRICQQAVASFGSNILKTENAEIILGLVNPIMFSAVMNCARYTGCFEYTQELSIPNAESVFYELDNLMKAF